MNALDTTLTIIRSLMGVLLILGIAPLVIWMERKVSAWMQDRPGPERAAIGPFRLIGIPHVVADAIKMLTKETFVPSHANKFYHYLAPSIIVVVAFTTISVMPLFDDVSYQGFRLGGTILDLDVGILWFLAVVSLAVYGVIFAGWSSYNKFALLGAMRASSAVLSYEIPMGLALIATIMQYGTISLPKMVQAQSGTLLWVLPKWGVFMQPVAALIFTVCAFAEANRHPFEMSEGEAELVAGYHTEYSGMKFAMFMLGEYGAIVTSSGIIASLYFGGWQVPYVDTQALIANAIPATQWILGLTFGLTLVLAVLGVSAFGQHFGRWKDMRDYEPLILAFLVLGGGLTALLLLFVTFYLQSNGLFPGWYGNAFAAVVQFHALLAKVLFFCAFFVIVRWTVPRFRYDQVMNLGWRTLLPLALANILVTGLVVTVF